MAHSELEVKQRRVVEFLDRHGLDGVMLWMRNNFAWITGGRDNHIVNASPVGVAAIVATREGSRSCLASTIEAPRMKLEELRGLGIEIVSFPWHDRAASHKTARDLIGGRKVAVDFDELWMGLPTLPGDFVQLRWSLTAEEMDRYRDGGRRASAAMERACREIKPGMTEHGVAGILDHHVHAAGCNPVVTLISSDERLPKFRHPIPTESKIRRHVMLVTCAEFGGLISNLTRFVHFGPLPDELKMKQQAVCNIDAAVNLATRPGRTLGDIFKDLQAAYAREGFADQWQYHHQGGSTGYAGREVLATPDSAVKVLENQAFAWNPSVVAAKSEDTVLVTGKGIEVLTAKSRDWPEVTGDAGSGQTFPRARILQL
jgi:Xaa-Pro aminopeptidase